MSKLCVFIIHGATITFTATQTLSVNVSQFVILAENNFFNVFVNIHHLSCLTLRLTC